jgi:hypothetical protein
MLLLLSLCCSACNRGQVAFFYQRSRQQLWRSEFDGQLESSHGRSKVSRDRHHRRRRNEEQESKPPNRERHRFVSSQVRTVAQPAERQPQPVAWTPSSQPLQARSVAVPSEVRPPRRTTQSHPVQVEVETEVEVDGGPVARSSPTYERQTTRRQEKHPVASSTRHNPRSPLTESRRRPERRRSPSRTTGRHRRSAD